MVLTWALGYQWDVMYTANTRHGRSTGSCLVEVEALTGRAAPTPSHTDLPYYQAPWILTPPYAWAPIGPSTHPWSVAPTPYMAWQASVFSSDQGLKKQQEDLLPTGALAAPLPDHPPAPGLLPTLKTHPRPGNPVLKNLLVIPL